jgi:mono/diheme cytochrome c family protein
VKRVALLLFLLACGDESGSDATAPSTPLRPVEVPEAPAPPPAPPEPARIPEGLRGDAGEGAVIYGQFCATCHGAGGKGDGAASAGLDPKPADHTDSAYMGALSDEHLYLVIQKGGAAVGKSPLMAPWGGVLNDAQIRDLVALLRRLSGTP